MKYVKSKFLSKLILTIFISSLFLNSLSTVVFAGSISPLQNGVLNALTLTNSQRVNFVSVVLDNVDELTFDQRVKEAKDNYLTSISSSDISTLLHQYDGFPVLQKTALNMIIMEGIPSNAIIGSTSTFTNITAFINNEITGNNNGLVNGQSNIGIRLMFKVLLTVAGFKGGAVASDSALEPATKISLQAPDIEGLNSMMDSLIASFQSLKSKISSRPEASNIDKLLGYTEDGINTVTDSETEMPHFKKCIRDYDANVYDGTYYYFALVPTSTPLPTPMPTPIKKITPKAPIVNPMDDGDKKLTGKAQPNATIFVKAGTVTVARGKVTKSGTFSVAIDQQYGGTRLEIFVEDSTGLRSNPTKITVIYIDPPTFSSLDNKDVSIRGHAEAGATVRLKINSKTIGSTIVKQDGTFTLKIVPLKAGTAVEGTAKDKKGHVSLVRKVVVKNIIPPKAPKVNSVISKDIIVAGSSQASAIITIKSGGKIIGTGTVLANGKFSIGIVPQKAGTVIIVTAKDIAGNVSDGAIVKVGK